MANKQLLSALDWGEPRLVAGWTAEELWGIPMEDEPDLEGIFQRWKKEARKFADQGLRLILLAGYRTSDLVALNDEELEEILETCEWAQMPVHNGEDPDLTVLDWLFPFLDRTGLEIWSLGGTSLSLYLPENVTALEALARECLQVAPDAEVFFPNRDALVQSVKETRRIDLWWD